MEGGGRVSVSKGSGGGRRQGGDEQRARGGSTSLTPTISPATRPTTAPLGNFSNPTWARRCIQHDAGSVPKKTTTRQSEKAI
eukprot:2837731-Rhodomonas_salina.1